jgi:hypothetical protein
LFGDGVVNVRHQPHYLDVDDDDANADYDPNLFDIEYDYGNDPGYYGLDDDDIANMAAEMQIYIDQRREWFVLADFPQLCIWFRMPDVDDDDELDR